MPCGKAVYKPPSCRKKHSEIISACAYPQVCIASILKGLRASITSTLLWLGGSVRPRSELASPIPQPNRITQTGFHLIHVRFASTGTPYRKPSAELPGLPKCALAVRRTPSTSVFGVPLLRMSRSNARHCFWARSSDALAPLFPISIPQSLIPGNLHA